jgi:hypothetical protein
MKLINYKYGYLFDCSIHGKIVVSKRMWNKIVKYLKRAKFETWYKDVVMSDVANPIELEKSKLYNIRTTATEKVVNKFHIKGNYKRANYMFQVV